MHTPKKNGPVWDRFCLLHPDLAPDARMLTRRAGGACMSMMPQKEKRPLLWGRSFRGSRCSWGQRLEDWGAPAQGAPALHAK